MSKAFFVETLKEPQSFQRLHSFPILQSFEGLQSFQGLRSFANQERQKQILGGFEGTPGEGCREEPWREGSLRNLSTPRLAQGTGSLCKPVCFHIEGCTRNRFLVQPCLFPHRGLHGGAVPAKNLGGPDTRHRASCTKKVRTPLGQA